jgi:hypothetical protein
MAKGKAVTPNPQDSSAVDENDTLDTILSKASVVFQGHPAEAAEDEPADEPKGGEEGAPKPADDAAPPQDQPPKEKPAKEGGGDKDDPLEAAQETIKTLEQRVKDNQRSFTESREENKKYREQVDKLSGQLQDLMVEMAKSRPAATKDTPAKDPLESVEQELSKMLDAIENLDPTDAQYRTKTVSAYKGMLSKFRDALNQEVESKLSLVQSSTDKKLEEQRKKDDEERAERDRVSKINTYAESKARESGLDMRTDIEQVDESGKKSKVNSADQDLFWRFAAYAKGDTTDEKIEWTIEEVKRVKAMIGQPIVRAKEKAKKTQENNSVLERGGSRPPENPEDNKPISFGEALAKAERRI